MRWVYILLILALTVNAEAASVRSHIVDFIKLVPRRQVAFLAGRHFLFDNNFRSALAYMRSSQFEALVRDEISPSKEIQDIEAYLGRDLNLDAVSRFIRKVVIRLRPPQEYGQVKTLSSFIREVANVLPDDKYRNLIREKSASDPSFAKLFAKIAAPTFKVLVYKARDSENLAEAFDTLLQNQVDVDEILYTGFELLGRWT